MAFPARKPEAGKTKNSWPCSTSDSNKNLRNNNKKGIFLQDQYQKQKIQSFKKLVQEKEKHRS